MAVWSEVNKSILGKYFGRIDAEFYRPINLFAINRVESVPHCNFGQLVKEGYRVVYGNTKILKQEENNEKTCRFLQATNISNDGMLIECDKVGHVSECDWNRYPKGRIKHGEILIEVKGQAEKVTIVPDDYPLRTLVSGSLYKASLKNDILTPEYVYAFFQSSTGKMLRDRTKTNTLISFVSKPELYSIPIPLFTKSDTIFITDLIKSALRKNKLSQSLYTQAQELLERELGLDKLVFDKPLSYEARLSEVVGNNRADADYYQIPFRSLGNHLKNLKTIPLGKMATIIKGIEVGSDSYVESGIPFLRVSNIKEKGISLGNSDKYISSRLYSALKCYQPQVGELLLTKDGTPGVCYTVTDEIEGIVSGGIVRLQLHDNSFPKEYLSLVVNSRICKMQIDQECSGALIVHWKPNSIRKLKIPVLSDSTMKELGRLVSESKKALTESRQLLEQAKRRVEELIEQAVQK